jgi:hypothetical protein
MPSAEAVAQPPPKPAVGIEVEVLKEKAALAVRFVNNGTEAITVLTEGVTFRGVEAVFYHWEVVFGLPEVTRHKGRVVVPALSRRGPVKLMPGEVTEPIAVSLDALYRAVQQPLGFPWGQTRVVYEVHPTWGERLGIWHGKVTVKAADSKITKDR